MADSIQDLRKQLPEGMTIQHTYGGQYRVNFRGGTEATAYYADDPQDALETAKAMAKQKASEPVKVIRPVLTHDEGQAVLAFIAIGMAFAMGHVVEALFLRAGCTKAELDNAGEATKKMMQLLDPEKYERLRKEQQL